MANTYRVITPKGIESIIEALCAVDPRIAQVRLGDIEEGDGRSDDRYPLVLFELVDACMEKRGRNDYTRWTVRLYCWEQRRKDNANVVDVFSETQMILSDFILRFRKEPQFEEWGFEFDQREVQFDFVLREDRDDNIGTSCAITFSTPLQLCLSDLPANGTLPDPGTSYPGTPVVPADWLTCSTLPACTVIQSIVSDIASLSASTGSFTHVQNGTNTTTGGTATHPTVNVVADPVFNDVTVNNLFALTLLSSPQIDAEYIGANVGAFNELEVNNFSVEGLTVAKNLYVGEPAEQIFGPTYVQNGTNTTTGGTITRPTVDVVADPTFTDVTASSLLVGTINATTLGSLSINGGAFASGGTDLSTIILRSRTRILPGTNTTTGGTFGAQTVDVVSSPSFTSVSASTIFSGGVDLSRYLTGSTQVRIQEGTNIITGGTAFAPTINVVPDPVFNSVSAGSGVINGTLNVGTVAAGALDASFILSGGTDLSLLLTGGSQSLGVRTSTSTTITPALSDAHGLITCSAATAIAFIIPSNSSIAFPIGSQVMIEQGSTGQVRFSGATGVTLNSYGNAYNMVGQYATAFATKTALNRWVIDGSLTTLSL